MAERAYVAGSWGFTDGVTAATQDPIAGTDDDLQYQTVHWGYGAWKLKADVPNGAYRVDLGFTETYFTATSMRVFNVKIEGQTAIAGLDLFAAAGHDTAYRRSFDVTVGDGQLDIEFVSVKDAALVATIELLGSGSTAPTPAATHTHTPTAPRTPTRTATPEDPTRTATPTRSSPPRVRDPHAYAHRRNAHTHCHDRWRKPVRPDHERGRGRRGHRAGPAQPRRREVTSRSPRPQPEPTASTLSPASRRCRPDASYHVFYGPNSADPTALSYWYGPHVTSYTAGASVPAGDFDIANVTLLLPKPNTTISLPVTFT